MLRNRIVNGQKASDATYVAHAELKRGMGVVKKDDKTAFPNSNERAGTRNIFVVDRDNVPSGAECAYHDRPDIAFDTIKAGEKVLLRSYTYGESFYTDQYSAVLPEYGGDLLGVGADGKWTNAPMNSTTKYRSGGIKSVAGIKMLIVEVVDEAKVDPA